MGADYEEVSRKVVDQRIRNRVIEHLELQSSFALQDDYQRAVPYIHVPYELINAWEDYIPRDPGDDPEVSSVYSDEEIEVLGRVHRAWNEAAEALPNDYPPLSDAQAMPEWQRWRAESASALAVFLVRGRSSEDHEDA